MDAVIKIQAVLVKKCLEVYADFETNKISEKI